MTVVHGQMQISAELVPIPDASRMRRDFELRQISAKSGKISAKFGQNLANSDEIWQKIVKIQQFLKLPRIFFYFSLVLAL